MSDLEGQMTQAGAADLSSLQRGALVLGTDLEIGALEEVQLADESNSKSDSCVPGTGHKGPCYEFPL